MQYEAAHHKIRKSSFGRNGWKITLVRSSRLYPQGNRQDELADSGTETCEEGVEGVVACEDAVQELQATSSDEKEEKGVNQLCPLRRLLHIVLVDVEQHVIPICPSALCGR